MGLLDLDDGERAQRRRQQTDAPVVEPPPNQINHEHGQQIAHCRQRAPHQMHLIVSGLPEPFGDVARDEDGERAIHEKAVAAIVRAER